jgi:hypothetical protein
MCESLLNSSKLRLMKPLYMRGLVACMMGSHRACWTNGIRYVLESLATKLVILDWA